jgi:hypothetical protein
MADGLAHRLLSRPAQPIGRRPHAVRMPFHCPPRRELQRSIDAHRNTTVLRSLSRTRVQNATAPPQTGPTPRRPTDGSCRQASKLGTVQVQLTLWPVRACLRRSTACRECSTLLANGGAAEAPRNRDRTPRVYVNRGRSRHVCRVSVSVSPRTQYCPLTIKTGTDGQGC